MNPVDFDRITKLFSDRRVSRRQAVRTAAAGAAVAGLSATGLTALAEEATPEPEEEESTKTQFLFLQSFQSGSIVPKEGEAGTWTLTLEQGLGQTVYFSNRPEKVFGVAPTTDFLENIGFSDDNPPNAALLFDDGEGNVDITVVELFNPRYEFNTQSVTYDVQWLAEYQQLDMTLQTVPGEPADAGATFGAAHLFIDDCADHDIECVNPDTNIVVGTIPNADHDGFCYTNIVDWCLPCKPHVNSTLEARRYWGEQCYYRFPACGPVCIPKPISGW